jgi:2-dehydro-3-deoxyglucarate aldolase/4-hydroxy-2-oxoheptanedioate aldolase
MGLPYQFEHPEHLAALERVATAAEKAGKAAGRMVTDVASGRRWREQGYRMLAYGPDTALLGRAVREGLDGIRST